MLEGVSAVNETSILLLTQPNDSGKCYIQLASFPGISRIVLFSYHTKATVLIIVVMFKFSEGILICVHAYSSGCIVCACKMLFESMYY